MKKMTFKNIKQHFPLIILIFFGIYSISYLKIRVPNISNKLFILFLIAFIFSIIFYFFIKKNIEKNIPIEKLFLITSIIIGLLYAFSIPILSGTDEPSHFYRAYQVSQGVFIDKSDSYDLKIEKDLLDLHYRKINENYKSEVIKKDLDKKTKVDLPEKDAIGSYSPLQYIPQALGIKIGLLLNLNSMFIVLIARILIFVVWVIFGYFAIKIFPYNKLLYFLFLTAPSILSLVSTCSGDVLLLGSSFLFISKILDFMKNKKQITAKDILLLTLLTVFISITKTVYFFLTFLTFLIPKECFKNKNKRVLFLIYILFLSIFIDLLWYYLASFYDVGAISNAKDQVMFIIKNPLKYLFIFIRTFFEKAYYYLVNIFAGNEMCYSRVNIPSILSIAYLALVILSFSKNDFKKNAKKEILLFWLVFILILGAASTAMYVYWTNDLAGVGYYKILGVQSRYLVMLIPPLLLPIKLNINIDEKKFLKYAISVNMSIYLCSISTIIISYLTL